MGKNRKKHVRPSYVPKEERKKKKERKKISKELKIGLAFCAFALVLAVVLFIVLYDDGSLPVKNGTVVAESNWVVANFSENGKKYYKLAEVGPIEGFSLGEEEGTSSDTNVTGFWFNPEVENNQFSYYYIAGISTPPLDMAESVQPYFRALYGDEESVSDVLTAIIDGREVAYFTSITAQTSDDGEETGESTQQLVCYAPTIRNGSLLISISAKVTEELPALSTDELLEFAERVMERIIFVE